LICVAISSESRFLVERLVELLDLLGVLHFRALGLLGLRLVFLRRVIGRDADERERDDADHREPGDHEHPRRPLLRDLGAAQLHLLREPLLLECGLMALALGRLGGLDAHARFALGGDARLFDRALVIALLANLGLFRLADLALGLFLGANARLFGAANRVLFFLDAALFDLA
jgi:hypothetical protein